MECEMTETKTHTICIAAEFCKGCAICTTVCPEDLLKIDHSRLNTQGYHPVCVDDAQLCVGCGNCTIMCPDNALAVDISIEQAG